MTILGKLDKRKKFGSIEERHVFVEDLTGPAADTIVPTGGTANVTFSIAGESPRDIEYAGLESITGLPAGVYIAGISFDKTAKTLTITLYNSTAADVTVTANSLSIRVVSIS